MHLFCLIGHIGQHYLGSRSSLLSLLSLRHPFFAFVGRHQPILYQGPALCRMRPRWQPNLNRYASRASCRVVSFHITPCDVEVPWPAVSSHRLRHEPAFSCRKFNPHSGCLDVLFGLRPHLPGCSFEELHVGPSFFNRQPLQAASFDHAFFRHDQSVSISSMCTNVHSHVQLRRQIRSSGDIALERSEVHSLSEDNQGSPPSLTFQPLIWRAPVGSNTIARDEEACMSGQPRPNGVTIGNAFPQLLLQRALHGSALPLGLFHGGLDTSRGRLIACFPLLEGKLCFSCRFDAVFQRFDRHFVVAFQDDPPVTHFVQTGQREIRGESIGSLGRDGGCT